MAKKEKRMSSEKLERIRTKSFFDCIAPSIILYILLHTQRASII